MGGQETAPLTLFSEGKARQDVATDYPGEFRSFSNGRVFSRADTMRNGGKMWTTVWCSQCVDGYSARRWPDGLQALIRRAA